MSIQLGVIGLNHKTADLALRELMADAAAALSGERARFFPHPTVLLSTCNRMEIYFSSEDPAAVHGDLLAFLRRYVAVPFEHRLYSYFGTDCFAHLCRVASGLDSAIVAETEIQRQVKLAYQRAKEMQDLPSSVHFAFQKALKIGKFVRGKFGLQRGAPTLASTIWELANVWKQGFTDRPILFVGYSEINRTILSYFLQKGARSIALCTRDSSLTVAHCSMLDRSSLSRWHRFDMVVCASHSSDYLIREAPDSPRLLFDLSVPRNIDPRLSSHCSLYNIEQLAQIIDQKRRFLAFDAARCEEALRDHALRLCKTYQRNRLHPSLATAY